MIAVASVVAIAVRCMPAGTIDIHCIISLVREKLVPDFHKHCAAGSEQSAWKSMYKWISRNAVEIGRFILQPVNIDEVVDIMLGKRPCCELRP